MVYTNALAWYVLLKDLMLNMSIVSQGIQRFNTVLTKTVAGVRVKTDKFIMQHIWKYKELRIKHFQKSRAKLEVLHSRSQDLLQATAFKTVLWTHIPGQSHRNAKFQTHKEMICHFQESKNAKEAPQKAGLDVPEPQMTEP